MRFPGFDGEWEYEKGNEIFENISNKKHNSDLPILAITQEYGAIPRDLIDYKISVTEKSIDSYKVVDKGDFIISLRSFQGGIEYSEYKGICSPAYVVLKPKKKIDNSFFKFFLKTPKYIAKLTKNLEGIRDGKMISYKYFSEIPLPYPSIIEQRKISTFLDLINERIQTQNKIIENQETLMLGVLTKLFNQKLKSFNKELPAFPLWEYKKGCDIFYNCSNKKHNSDLPILAITQEYGAVPRDLIDHNITVTEKSIDSYKVVDKGDFIISLRSFQGGIEYSNYHGICSPAYIILKNSIDIVPEFYKYYLKSAAYIKLLNKKLEGIRDGKMISYNYFSEINLPYPCLEEQKYIADILTTIDNKIKIEKQMLNLLSKQKDYLLQQMLI